MFRLVHVYQWEAACDAGFAGCGMQVMLIKRWQSLWVVAGYPSWVCAYMYKYNVRVHYMEGILGGF